MDEENTIDLTGQSDEIPASNDEFNVTPSITSSTTGSGACTGTGSNIRSDNNNLDEFDYLVDAVQNNNVSTEGMEVVNALSLWNNFSNNHNGVTAMKCHPLQPHTAPTRFVPNKNIPKRHGNTGGTGATTRCELKQEESSISTTNDPRSSTPPNRPTTMTPHIRTNHNTEWNDKNRKRMRVQNYTTGSRSSHEGHFEHHGPMEWRRRQVYHDPRRYHHVPTEQHSFHQRRIEYQHEPEFVRYNRDASTRWRDMDDTNRQLGDNLRAQSIAAEKREKELMAKENELLKAKVDWTEQKAAMVHEIEITKHAFNMDRDEHEKRCRSQIDEIERYRIEVEQEMCARRAAVEGQLNELQEQFQREQQQSEDDIQRRRQGLDERENILTRQQCELDVRLLSCANQETILIETRQSNEAEFEAQRESLRLQQLSLNQQYEELRVAIESHQQEVEMWKSNTANERANLNQRIVDFNKNILIRTTELDSREAEQLKRQLELDSRGLAQRRRKIQLKARKQVIDETKPEREKKNTVPTTKPGKTDPLVDLRTGKPVDYIMIDSDDDDDHNHNFSSKHKKATPSTGHTKPENMRSTGTVPQRRETNNEKGKFNSEAHYNYSYTEETAFELQERLFREAAERLRTRPTAAIATGHSTVTITTPMMDVAVRYPHHWQWKDPYAILGLPANASVSLIKSQYRRLARTYHPDKSSAPNTSTKFHSVSSAYHKLTENL